MSVPGYVYPALLHQLYIINLHNRTAKMRLAKCRYLTRVALNYMYLTETGAGLIIAAMLDLQSPLVALSTLPNLTLLLKSKMAAIAFARSKICEVAQINRSYIF